MNGPLGSQIWPLCLPDSPQVDPDYLDSHSALLGVEYLDFVSSCFVKKREADKKKGLECLL